VARPLVRFEGLPGEFSQHGFGEVDVEFGNGTARRVHFFVSRLKYSRWAQVSLVEDERVEALVRSLVDHFAAMGGLPLLAVFDRPKTVALAWRRDGVVTSGIRPSLASRWILRWASSCAGPIAPSRRARSRTWSAG
jgi:transposase